MPTIVDSLILELGLDPKKFSQDAKVVIATSEVLKDKALDAGKKVETISVKSANTIVDQYKKNQEANRKSQVELQKSNKASLLTFTKLSEAALGLFAIFLGGKGLKDYVEDTARMNVTLGRNAYFMDQSIAGLSSWQGAVEAAGGSADGLTASMSAFTQDMQNFQMTGQSGMIPYLRSLGVNVNATKTTVDYYMELADKLKAMDPARAANYASALHIDQGTLAFLVQGSAKIKADLAEQRKFAPTDQELKNSKELLQTWTTFQRYMSRAARITVFDNIIQGTDMTLKALMRLGNWVDNNGGLLSILTGGFAGGDSGVFPWSKDRYKEKPSLATGPAVDIFAGGGGGSHSGGSGSLGDLISRGEGGYSSVNLGQAGGYKSATRDLARMTVNEVLQAQRQHQFNAAGRYEMVPATLSAAVAALGMTGKEKFDPATQDRIFRQFLLGNKRPQIRDYLSGKSNDLGAALMAMSQEWASVADPRTGQSHYPGQRATIGSSEVAKILQQMRAQGAGSRAMAENNSHSETHIGTIHVNTKANDARAIVRDIGGAIKDHSFASQANYGAA